MSPPHNFASIAYSKIVLLKWHIVLICTFGVVMRLSIFNVLDTDILLNIGGSTWTWYRAGNDFELLFWSFFEELQSARVRLKTIVSIRCPFDFSSCAMGWVSFVHVYKPFFYIKDALLYRRQYFLVVFPSLVLCCLLVAFLSYLVDSLSYIFITFSVM